MALQYIVYVTCLIEAIAKPWKMKNDTKSLWDFIDWLSLQERHISESKRIWVDITIMHPCIHHFTVKCIKDKYIYQRLKNNVNPFMMYKNCFKLIQGKTHVIRTSPLFCFFLKIAYGNLFIAHFLSKEKTTPLLSRAKVGITKLAKVKGYNPIKQNKRHVYNWSGKCYFFCR